ncbi:MAG: division/cell wall cluster transcriptional repressor MraZ [Bacteroidetes bacterium]|nr:division/cell wall cluster transcriptional repressor MraZ [Bacteroidota bacterium]
MFSFTGQYEVKVDGKGRLRLPSDLLRQIPEDTNTKYVINKGLDKCLRLYPMTQWNSVTAEMNKNLSWFQSKERTFARYFFQAAAQVEVDSNDRIIIPKRLIDDIGIQAEVVIIAFGEVIEIWNSEEFYNNIAKEPEDFANMADEIWSKINNNK